jgi:hypothetical protein
MALTMTASADQSVLDEDLFGIKVPPLDGYRSKQCPVRLQNDCNDEYDESDKEPDTSQTVFIMAEGVVYESDIGDELVGLLNPFQARARAVLAITDGKGQRDAKLSKLSKLLKRHPVVFVPECDRTVASKKRRELITQASMVAGVKFIWNARLPSEGQRSGEPDYLVRLGGHTKADGMWAYLPCDVKHHSTLDGGSAPREWPSSTLSNPMLEDATDRGLGRGTPRLGDLMQLCHYTHMLRGLGHATDGCPQGAIVGKERFPVWFDLTENLYLYARPGEDKRSRTSAMEIYNHEFSFRQAVARRALERNEGSHVDLLVAPEWKAECHACPWRTVCKDELKAGRHITLLPGITPARAKAHYAQGVTTIDQLARLDVPTAVVVDAKEHAQAVIDTAKGEPSDRPAVAVLAAAGVKDPSGLASALESFGITDASSLAKLDSDTARYSNSGVWHLARSIDQARVTLVERVHRARGVDTVSLTDPAIALHFDVENDGPYVYLIRFHAVGKARSNGKSKERVESHAFVCWDSTPEGEARVFVEAWEYLQMMRAKARTNKYSLRAFHYTGHERGVYKMLAERHAGIAGIPSVQDVEAWFDSAEVVDLHEVLSAQLLWPTEDVTLKTLAKYVKFVWRDDDPSGANSIAWYRKAISPDSDEELADEYRQRVLDYNEDDCKATAALVEFIHRLGEARRPASKLPSVETLDRRFRRRRR